MRPYLLQGVVLAFAGFICSQAIVNSPGDKTAIPSWSIQSSRIAADLPRLSQPGADVSSWYRMGSKGSVVAGLLEASVYKDSELFYSQNMEPFIASDNFTVPWVYQHEFELHLANGSHYFVETNGITSRADLYVNGVLIAGKDVLKGSYGGKKLDITDHVRSGANVILIQAYPTNYLRDFAMGFVDWNPYPADNGTGVWRDVLLSTSGPVSMSKPRITTDFKNLSANSVRVSVNTVLRNHGLDPAEGVLKAQISGLGMHKNIPLRSEYQLEANVSKTISMSATISDPQIWWPAAWGSQPLYNLTVTVSAANRTSDYWKPQSFGIRHVTSEVNAHNDTAFSINNLPFQVRGAGYGPDIFYRFDSTKLRTQFQYMLDMGLNTVRLEGKMEHPELYDLADSMGLMVLPGWECCDKWEGWTYNDEANGEKWIDQDYDTAADQMRHEAAMIQDHPSILGFLVGSDFWPNDRAAKIYLDILHELDFDNPIIASAAKRGYPDILGPSGMKMDGPYDWVPPNYWYNDQLGAAFGFGSELGAGVGTPTLSSLRKFLSKTDLSDLWRLPDKDLFHMSRYDSSFHNRKIYNDALWARYGAPSSLDDYVLKAQVADYEATKAQYEAYGAMQSAQRPATGLVYWMLNPAWPNLHWALFDYYLHPMGAYYGVKAGAQKDLAVLNYNDSSLWLVNHGVEPKAQRTVEISMLRMDGTIIGERIVSASTAPLSSQEIGNLSHERQGVRAGEVGFLRLLVKDEKGATLGRNTYWLPAEDDVMDWNNSTWYTTPVTKYADFTALSKMQSAALKASVSAGQDIYQRTVTLENESKVPAFFVALNLRDSETGEDVVPVFWQDNYITLWPGEKTEIGLSWNNGSTGTIAIEVQGWNVWNVADTPL